MTTIIRGQDATLEANFQDFAGGPFVDVTNLSLRIVSITDGSVVAGPTTAITHVATGVYTYVWSVPGATPLGDYVVEWTSDEASASEILSVIDVSESVGTGPCDMWPVTWQCDLNAIEGAAAVTGAALVAASNILWSLSGQRFSVCPSTLRLCRRECSTGFWPMGTTQWDQTYPTPYWWNGEWFNLACGSCTTDCSCSVVEEFLLPAPIYRIIEIKIDGVVLSPSAYRVDNNRIVVRVDGGTWPLCNDLSKNDTEVGTWSVTAQYGEDIPEFGKIAVGELACEFVKAMTGGTCTLPQPVQSIARQGVNITYLDPQEAFGDGRTGLRFSDLFISTYNPGGLRARSRSYNVDGPNPRRTNQPQ